MDYVSDTDVKKYLAKSTKDKDLIDKLVLLGNKIHTSELVLGVMLTRYKEFLELGLTKDEALKSTFKIDLFSNPNAKLKDTIERKELIKAIFKISVD
jgi:hypothetical protein